MRVWVDGASRGNPGEAGYGVYAPEGGVSFCGYLGVTTNNVAEYQALLHALRFLFDRGVESVEVFSDSELMVRQLNGQYRVKNAGLLPLYTSAKILMSRFASCVVAHVPREQNQHADKLANLAVDTKGAAEYDPEPRK